MSLFINLDSQSGATVRGMLFGPPLEHLLLPLTDPGGSGQALFEGRRIARFDGERETLVYDDDERGVVERRADGNGARNGVSGSEVGRTYEGGYRRGLPEERSAVGTAGGDFERQSWWVA
ncbi:hypothetical protein HO133_003007 [Letharia lupina]|uniref:Uncharacterized protein n=1 Tax=Letharia lupina TaxID=560253 RepID=A0A8H6CBV1_9LECA|nr:uncharacterized protein HO133_003007 [Letharia lupina]KAF6220574.1 hypothetical protein HO133_003007 [Letharia lupina]